MSKGYPLGAKQALRGLGPDSHPASGEATFIQIFKTFCTLTFVAAVLFSALVVPFCRESILTAVTNWLQVIG